MGANAVMYVVTSYKPRISSENFGAFLYIVIVEVEKLIVMLKLCTKVAGGANLNTVSYTPPLSAWTVNHSKGAHCFMVIQIFVY